MSVENVETALTRTLRGVLTIVLSVAVLAGGAAVFATLASYKQPPAEKGAVPRVFSVDVFRVQQTNAEEWIAGFGTVKADRDVQLAAEVAGVVVDGPLLKVGTQVEGEVPSTAVTQPGTATQPRTAAPSSSAGVILRIDPEVYEQRLEQARNALHLDSVELELIAQQEANVRKLLEKANNDFQLYSEELARIEELARKNVAAGSDVTRTRLELQRYREAALLLENELSLIPIRREQLESRAAGHRADLRLAEIDRERTVIRCPFTGQISAVFVEVGQHVRVGDPLVRVTDVDVVEIPVALPLADFARIATAIQRGELPEARLAENESAATRWTGQVVRVSPLADQSTRTAVVWVRVDNRQQSSPLLPGAFVSARLRGPRLSGVIAIPRDAILNGQVFIARNDAAVSQVIQVEKTIDSFAIVSSGISVGDEVILSNLDVLESGSAIRVQNRRLLEDELRLLNSDGSGVSRLTISDEPNRPATPTNDSPAPDGTSEN